MVSPTLICSLANKPRRPVLASLPIQSFLYSIPCSLAHFARSSLTAASSLRLVAAEVGVVEEACSVAVEQRAWACRLRWC